MIPKRVRCPQCGSKVEYRIDNPSRPFCSERCKLMDLGAWAAERYAIPGVATSSGIAADFPADDIDDPAEEGPRPTSSNRRFQS